MTSHLKAADVSASHVMFHVVQEGKTKALCGFSPVQGWHPSDYPIAWVSDRAAPICKTCRKVHEKVKEVKS